MKKFLMLTALAAVLSISANGQSATDDREAVRQAVLDYVEGVYEVAPERIERSVHPELVKRGFFVRKNETAYSPHVMTFQQLVDLSKSYNKDGRVAKDAPKEIVIFDVADQTASAKLTAVWGIDYFHLAKYEGKWKILNVLWQSPPKH
ncbi:MAG: nuclear transport factor 2 family protein [Pyrinomonadaceae bacterium]